MIKKLLIAAAAVVVGVVVLTRVTKISPMVWLGECCSSARKMVSPDLQLKQLKKEIVNIDKDIVKNIGRVAGMEIEVENFEKDLNGQLARQGRLKAEMEAMRKSLETNNTRVVFHGDKMAASDLTRKLHRCTNEYVTLRETNKIHEKVLEQKKRTLETAHDRLAKMQQEQVRLNLVAERLAGHIEAVKAEQMTTPVEFDDSSISRCHELANDIEARLNTAEREAKLLRKYGYSSGEAAIEEANNREEVLKAANKALREESESVAVEKGE